MLNTADWATRTYNVTSVMLDEANIRLEDAHASQEAIIQDLFANYKAFDLVKSILEFGLFNHELPIVVEEDKTYIVLEGNRRLAALKAIINPKLVPKYEKQIIELKKAAGDTSSLKSIEVKVATSRADAARVIATIHTVRSRIPWRPLRQAYFYFAQITSGKKTIEMLRDEYPDVDIPRFVRMWEMHSIAKSISYDAQETQSKVNSRNFPISTFERIYSNDSFKQKAGINFNEHGRVNITSDKQQFQKLIKKVVTDIADKNIDSRVLNRMDSNAAKNYLGKLPSPKKASKTLTSDDFKEPETRAIRRTKLVDTPIECILDYPALTKMLNELKKIPYGRYPNATHDFLRSFLEKSLKGYLQHIGQTPARNLDKVLDQSIRHFNLINRKDLGQVLTIIKGGGRYLYSADYMDALNHNHQVFSVGEDVEAAWDQMKSVIKYVLDPPVIDDDSNKNT